MDTNSRATLIGREVIYTARFEEELGAIEPNTIRADEFVRGVEWQICRYPESGKRRSNNSIVWGKPITAVLGLPSIIVYYTFDENYIWFLSIQVFDYNPDIEWL